MSRRVPPSEIGFESDSFLDIIANIVGILIILIVLAGVRVSNAPVLPLLDVAQPDGPPEDGGLRMEDSGWKTEDENLPPSSILNPPTPPPPPSVPSPELIAAVRELKAEMGTLDAQTLSVDRSLEQLTQAHRQADRQSAGLSAALAQETDALEAEKRAVSQLRAELSVRREAARRSRFQLAKTEQQRPPTRQIRHKLTPVGQTVSGKEIHFHLARNRVAAVPLEELLDRLRAQVIRQRHWLTKFNSHQGSIGPVRGFTMNYVVARERLSIVEELRSGRGVMRIGVSEWQLIPEPNIAAESAAEALRPGSEFHRALLAVDAETVLTFWVYPDSFKLYRKLQQVAHEEDFTVAGRPLPFGVPISGSPNGSRSSGQ